MTKNTKTILGVLVVGGLIYYAYQKKWLKNPFKSFAGEGDFFSFTANEDTFHSTAFNR
jgi:hypothetical protein